MCNPSGVVYGGIHYSTDMEPLRSSAKKEPPIGHLSLCQYGTPTGFCEERYAFSSFADFNHKKKAPLKAKPFPVILQSMIIGYSRC